jgi:hypothetical protein
MKSACDSASGPCSCGAWHGERQLFGERRCSHCTSPVVPHKEWDDGDFASLHYAAWVAGFCCPMCMRNAALASVATGSAWWIKGDSNA